MSNFKDLDALLQKYVDDGLPGCGMVIAKKGEILYEKYFGYADVENKVPLEQKHLFRQASLTKVAMYTTAMMLYEQGKFLMTDPIYEYFPEWRNSTKLVKKRNFAKTPTIHWSFLTSRKNMGENLHFFFTFIKKELFFYKHSFGLGCLKRPFY